MQLIISTYYSKMEEQTASTLRLAVVNRATEPTESEIRNILEDQVFKEGHLTYYNYVFKTT